LAPKSNRKPSNIRWTDIDQSGAAPAMGMLFVHDFSHSLDWRAPATPGIIAGLGRYRIAIQQFTGR
jgi:hypothetical protein